MCFSFKRFLYFILLSFFSFLLFICFVGFVFIAFLLLLLFDFFNFHILFIFPVIFVEHLYIIFSFWFCIILIHVALRKNTKISPNFFGVEILLKRTISAEFLAIQPKLCRNCTFPQNVHIRKLGEKTAFYVAQVGRDRQ